MAANGDNERKLLQRMVWQAADNEGVSMSCWCSERGINYQTLMNYGNGKRGMTLWKFHEWCELLGAEPWKVMKAASMMEVDE